MNAQENNIRLSIIVPVYNAEKYLDDCILSLLNQDLPEDEYEIIFVNDGSTDNSVQVIEKYMSNHPCIRLISQANAGVSAARNKGIENSLGIYIAFVDSDDYLVKDSFGQLLRKMESIDFDVVRFKFKSVEEKSKFLVVNEQMNFEIFPFGGGIQLSPSVWRLIIRKSVINENNIRFDEQIKNGEDLLFTSMLSAVVNLGKRWDVQNRLYCYRQRSNSVSHLSSEDSKIQRMKDWRNATCELKKFLSRTETEKAQRDFIKEQFYKSAAVSLLYALQCKTVNAKQIRKELKQIGAFPYPIGFLFRGKMNKGRIAMILIRFRLFFWFFDKFGLLRKK